MTSKKISIAVGAFVVLGMCAFLFLALQAANLLQLNWQSSYKITAYFDNIGGLKPKAALKSAGVVVGRVDAIAFDDKTYRAQVSLSLDSRYHFPKDSSFKILTSGLLGEQYIGIEAGSSTEPLQSGEKINDTQSAIVLENLISQFLFSKASEGKSVEKK